MLPGARIPDRFRPEVLWVRDRATAVKLYNIDMAMAREQVMTEGRAELLLKQLNVRFSPLTDEAKARVQSAKPEQLDLWAKRILTAKTLEEVSESS